MKMGLALFAKDADSRQWNVCVRFQGRRTLSHYPGRTDNLTAYELERAEAKATREVGRASDELALRGPC